MDCIIGIDGGGTKTQAKAVSLKGDLLAEAKSGSSNLCSNSFEAVEANIKTLVNLLKIESIINPVAVCIGTAGLNGLNAPEKIHGILADATGCTNIRVIGDMELPLFALGDDHEVAALISGTGSVASARSKSGKTSRVGGWGHIVGDEGSGYWLTVQAIGEAMREFDGRGEKTILTQMLLDAFGCSTPPSFITMIHDRLNKQMLAEKSFLVEEAATKGDSVANKILLKGADLLFELLCAAIKTAELGEDFSILLMGGVLTKSQLIPNILKESILSRYPHAKIIEDSLEAVDCAVKVAAQMLKGLEGEGSHV